MNPSKIGFVLSLAFPAAVLFFLSVFMPIIAAGEVPEISWIFSVFAFGSGLSLCVTIFQTYLPRRDTAPVVSDSHD